MREPAVKDIAEEGLGNTDAIAVRRKWSSAGVAHVAFRFAKHVLMKTSGESATDPRGYVQIVNGFE